MTQPRGLRNNNPLNIRRTGDQWQGLSATQGAPASWMMIGTAMAIQENGTQSLDYFAMLHGWSLCWQG